MRQLHLLIAATFAFGVVACDKTDDVNPVDPNQPATNVELHDDHWTNTTPADQGPGALDPFDVRSGRDSRRVTVDQLRKSIPMLMNGATWTVRFRGQDLDAFDALSRTLGEADYLEVTEANEDPSPLFAKFMDDMAGQVCSRALQDDAQAPAADRAVVPYPNDVDQNLRFLRLKFHSIHVPDGSTEGIEDLRKLYDDILADTGEAGSAWLGVCIAVITDPELMAY